jgi:hypothetical protein
VGVTVSLYVMLCSLVGGSVSTKLHSTSDLRGQCHEKVLYFLDIRQIFNPRQVYLVTVIVAYVCSVIREYSRVRVVTPRDMEGARHKFIAVCFLPGVTLPP